jgi:hypothetical protein
MDGVRVLEVALWGFVPAARRKLKIDVDDIRARIDVDIIAWECDYPHTATTWPESPELAWSEFEAAGCTPEEIHKITWENACRFFDWDPFEHTPKDQATVGALRALAHDVDVTRIPKEEWRKRNEAAGIGVF